MNEPKIIYVDDVDGRIEPFILGDNKLKPNVWGETYQHEILGFGLGIILLPMRPLDITPRSLLKHPRASVLRERGCFDGYEINYTAWIHIVQILIFVVSGGYAFVKSELIRGIWVLVLAILSSAIPVSMAITDRRRARQVVGSLVSSRVCTTEINKKPNIDELCNTGKIKGHVYFNLLTGTQLWISLNDLKAIKCHSNTNFEENS